MQGGLAGGPSVSPPSWVLGWMAGLPGTQGRGQPSQGTDVTTPPLRPPGICFHGDLTVAGLLWLLVLTEFLGRV